MGSSLLSAGRAIHIKIVSVAFVCAIVVVLVGLKAKISYIENSFAEAGGPVFRAGQPATYAIDVSWTAR